MHVRTKSSPSNIEQVEKTITEQRFGRSSYSTGCERQENSRWSNKGKETIQHCQVFSCRASSVLSPPLNVRTPFSPQAFINCSNNWSRKVVTCTRASTWLHYPQESWRRNHPAVCSLMPQATAEDAPCQGMWLGKWEMGPFISGVNLAWGWCYLEWSWTQWPVESTCSAPGSVKSPICKQ